MNFLKRAFISVKRNLGKSITLFLMLFSLSSLMAGGLLVRDAIITTGDVLRAQLPAVTTVGTDWISGRRVDPALIQQIGELPYVRMFDYSLIHRFSSRELEMVQLEGTDTEIGGMYPMPIVGFQNFLIKGVHRAELLDIEAGVINLVAGRTFTETEIAQGGAVIVSEDLMAYNQLNLGDWLTLDAFVFDWEALGFSFKESFELMEDYIFAHKMFKVEIIGIFTVNSEMLIEIAEEINVNTMEVLMNRIYAPNVMVTEGYRFQIYAERELGQSEWYLHGEADNHMRMDPIYVLYDPRDLESFNESANAILPSGWEMMDLRSSYADVASSMEMIDTIADQIVIGATIAVLLIVTLLIALFLRERRHEIGIYLALGEKRIRIVIQIILEVLVVAVFSMTLALFVGHRFSDYASRVIMQNEMLNLESVDAVWAPPFAVNQDFHLFTLNVGNVTIDEFLEQYNVSLTAISVIFFYSIGITVVLLSTILPIGYVVKLKPKKVLM